MVKKVILNIVLLYLCNFCYTLPSVTLIQLLWLSAKRPWCWEGLGAGGEGDDRGWDGWMASPTQWTWVWVNSRSWWWTGRPGVLQSMGSQRVGHDWVTELNCCCGTPNSGPLHWTSLLHTHTPTPPPHTHTGISITYLLIAFFILFECYLTKKLSLTYFYLLKYKPLESRNFKTVLIQYCILEVQLRVDAQEYLLIEWIHDPLKWMCELLHPREIHI